MLHAWLEFLMPRLIHGVVAAATRKEASRVSRSFVRFLCYAEETPDGAKVPHKYFATDALLRDKSFLSNLPGSLDLEFDKNLERSLH